MTRNSLRFAAYALAAVTVCVIAGCPADSMTGDIPGAGDGGAGSGGGTDPNNKAPTAALSMLPNTPVAPATPVTMDASTSSDPDGDLLTFEWSQTAGMTVTLSSTTDATVTFAAPFATDTTELKFSVTVSDGRGGQSSAEASLMVTVDGEFAGHPQAVVPYRDTLTSDEAYHLLRRAALGATPDDVIRATQRGLGATVDDLLTMKPVPDSINALVDTYDDDMPKVWLTHLIEGPNPLHERMAMFWHDRFATSRRVLEFRDRNLAMQHWNMLRANALGNYRVFLDALTLDPLMLIWLDGANSPKTSPNENYAREFWELFTLGRDVLYTEQDIRESARAFTGITLLRQGSADARPIFDLYNHDETPKSIFPARTTAPANYNYQGVIALTLAQPEAPRYVARNLFEFFVHDHPSDAVVQELANLLVANDYNIAPLVRKILTSQAMFSIEARGNQICSPVEHLVGVARTLDMHIYSEDSQGYIFDRLRDELAGAGQELMNPPGVQGWDEGLPWLDDQWVLNRARALGRTMEYGPSLTEGLPYHLLPGVETWNQREVRDRMVSAAAGIFHLTLTPEERDIYIEVLDQKGYLAFNLEQARYQPQHVFEMLRLMAMDERVLGR